jgi:CrcB protein
VKHVFDGLAVAGGGALGALLRWIISLICGRFFGHDFPVGTLVINLTGSFFLGWFLARGEWSDTVRLGFAVGFVGAYTTFSTFMFETTALWDHGAFIRACAYVAGSIVLGLIAVRLGIYCAR